jgi:hypothetical protein
MAMDKPDKPYPNVPGFSTPQYMPPQIPDPSIRGASWDQLLKQRGIRFIHQRAVPCPNMKSLDADNHHPDCTFCDSSGFLYYGAKEIYGVFYSNSLEKMFEKQGVWEVGVATATFPTEYEDGTQCEFGMYDSLTIPDFQVRLWELKEYEPRPQNLQQLRYPIAKIDHMSIVRNGQLIELQQGVDFDIVDGKIQWRPGKTPKYDNVGERGEVFTVSYLANPVYIVWQPLRELRVSQEMVDGQKVARRLPQQVLLKRDFLVNGSEKFPGK